MSSTTPTTQSSTPDATATPAPVRRPSRGMRLGRFASSTTAAVLISAAAALATTGTAQASPELPSAPPVAAAAYTTATYYWGAIAYSPSTGATGYSWDYSNSRAAARGAVSKCGVRDCQSLVEVANGCASLAQASNGALGWAYGASGSAADATARRSTPGPNPHVVGWVCTTGHR